MMETDTYSAARVKIGALAWHVCCGYEDKLREWLSVYFPGVLAERNCQLKNEPGSRVAVARGLVIKESTVRKGRMPLRFGIRASGSRRAFCLGHRLVQRGIPTPRPVAWATVRYLGLRVRDFLVTEEIEGGRPLTDDLISGAENSAVRQQTLALLGRLLASFHHNGFSNRDMKHSNILVTGARDMRLWVVDLDGVRRRPVMTRRRVLRDFYRVLHSLGLYGWTTEADRRCLLTAYNADVPERLRIDELPAADVC